jgi:hypothetical protein
MNVAYKPTKLVIRGKMTAQEYAGLLATLGGMARNHQWWVGDALVDGEKRFGEDEYSQLVESADLEPHTLTNYRWVAASVEPSRRREDLSWSHHAEVARLAPETQTLMLAEAVERSWGVRELREAVAIRYPQSGREPETPPETGQLSAADEALIARRLEGLGTAIEDARKAGPRWHEHVNLDDVQWLYRLALHFTRGGR